MSGRIIFLLAAILTLNGCFTVLQHPVVERETYLSSEITHTDRCTACHAQSAEYWYKNPYEMEAPYTNPHLTSWNYYYNYPWWLRDRFLEERYTLSSDSSAEVIPVNLRGRRRGLDAYTPAAVPSSPNSGLGLSATSGGNAGTSANSISSPGAKKREGIDSSPKKSSQQTRIRKKKKE
ncbi:MAG: hypothetical protein GXO76_04620 [Calditrichaeota bacterium]|nr:hypothetical protein [Calditrichota bacterium]